MSFDIAISGLNAINQQLGAISNNIANSGTVGFKSGRAEFASLYAEGQPLGVGVTLSTVRLMLKTTTRKLAISWRSTINISC